jgi:transcriptional regulator with XRE-family HTH domain
MSCHDIFHGMTLREWRKSKGLTLQQLAERVEVSASQLAKIEKGNSTPSVAAASRIAAVTDGEINALQLLGLPLTPRPKGVRPKRVEDSKAGFSVAQSGAMETLEAEAESYGLDPDAIARKAIEDAVKAERIRRWNEENREAIESWNELVEREGLWSDGIRAF